ncbi:MAG: tRNA (adenosine(37)-N6)-threonylcarbamoyltransferase complex dimerization subunit type 1 TsaB, partial [Alphaproteobacteria bacterium]|nr:tRNA (adenosine(37)-N6)-threonylcarbamoyltransferase complex dimerization subunit type 1 TsaB [Alphaproteobacteria bacterium]
MRTRVMASPELVRTVVAEYNPAMSDGKLTLLALDSATTGCSVCVWRGGDILAHDMREMARGQAEVLLPMTAQALIEADVAPEDIDAVAVTRGPGAFTGLRIALSAARAFALARAIPCIGVTTLEAVARAVPDAERDERVILAAVESKRDDIYAQLFSPAGDELSEPLAADGAALAGLFSWNERVLIVGDAAGRAQD